MRFPVACEVEVQSVQSVFDGTPDNPAPLRR
jgi:hypothetical protein